MDQLHFLLVEDPLLPALGQQVLDVVLRHETSLAGAADAEDGQEGARGAAQQDDEAARQARHQAQGVGHEQRHGLRVAQGQGLGHQLPDDQLHVDDTRAHHERRREGRRHPGRQPGARDEGLDVEPGQATPDDAGSSPTWS